MQTAPILATKRPVTNEAWQWDGSTEAGELICDWIQDNGGFAHMHPYENVIVVVDGDSPVRPGQWVIRDQFNDFYPCPDRTFQAVYVRVGQ